MKKTAVTLILAVCVNTFATAETVHGVLEKGAIYSALFSASRESGDLIGYPFKNLSAIGKAILSNCLPGMRCNIGKAAIRSVENTASLKFAHNPSGWMEITMAKDVGMETVVFGYDKQVKTRYGLLSVREDDNILLFKNKPVVPTIEGNNSLSIVANYELGKTDVILLQNNGGTACPALYRFVTVSMASVSVTPEFGTCSDIIYPTSDLKTSITVAMVGDKAMTKAVFQYVDGRLIN